MKTTDTPESDAAWNYAWDEGKTLLMGCHEDHLLDTMQKLELERNELAGYLCRVKLPLPVKFVANLADIFPGKNVRMKDEGGYLCIFLENDLAQPPAGDTPETPTSQ